MAEITLTPIHPASCRADMPLPINTTARITTRTEVNEKKRPRFIRALVYSITQAIKASSNTAVIKPPAKAVLLPSAINAE
ncbi:conserved hypothetical protein [Ricinus communis]|uniref:Uncharacterized protein n=1 Tax=Ricinus communis TaxID=3988 RepID=B9TKK4_RICCO|nr:conserved hypothetical protein [Ricinus communis]